MYSDKGLPLSESETVSASRVPELLVVAALAVENASRCGRWNGTRLQWEHQATTQDEPEESTTKH